MQSENKVDYHAGMIAALKFAYDDQYDFMETVKEIILGEKPPRLDAVVIKKKADVKLTDSIGSFFREHNLIEFKGASDGININDFFKIQGYALMYMTIDKKVNEIPHDNMTINVIQYRYPREVFKYLEEHGCSIIKRFVGVYEVCGRLTTFPFQIINVKEMENEWETLKFIASNADSEVFLTVQDKLENVKDNRAREHLMTVLEIAFENNQELFETMKGEGKMREAVARMFKKEIEEIKNEFEERDKGIITRMLRANTPVKQIKEFFGWPLEKILSLAKEIGVKPVIS